MIKDSSFGVIPAYKNEKGIYEFLIIDQKTYNGNFIGFPKGHAEAGESDIVAAKRELEEEVGIKDVEIDKDRFGSFGYKFVEKGKKYDKTVKYRLGYVKNKQNTIQIEELNSCKWVSFDEVLAQVSHKNMKKIFVEITKGIV